MALSALISTKELQRQAELCLEGNTVNVMLCNSSGNSFTAESTVADWQTAEVTGSGYVRFSQTVQAGSYNSGLASYVIPNIDAAFECDTTPLSYDRIIIYFTGETYIHSMLSENPTISLTPGQAQTYRISLRQDD
jgi:hypothetical protein